MKKILKYMLLLLLCVPTACTDDPADSEPWQLKAGEGKVVMRFYAQFPEAHAAATRTWADEPVYENLDLYCVVFDDGGHPSRNYLTQVKPAICYPDKKSQTEINGTKVDIIPFEVELDAISEENAIIHFIAIDNTIAPEVNPLLQKENLYGPENVVIPRMTVSGGHDAYWQRIALGFPIKNSNADEIGKFVSKTSPVPLIRNFAKISVTWDPDPEKGQNEDDFQLLGFCVINTLDRGTIAPYSELLPDGFPQFVDFENGRRPYNYDEIVDAKTGQGYTGVRATGSRVQNPGMVPADTNDGSSPYTLTQKYVYERPFSETNHTYIIVKGLYKKGEAQAPTYYKLDIGTSQKEFGVFEFSNLLRNFDFHIRITAVSADGYATTEDAAKGLIYNNNISAALETQHLLSISNGYHMMYVNFTSYVIVRQEDAIELLYRYFDLGSNPDEAGMAGSKQIKNEVRCLEVEKGTVNGDVIESVTKGPERKEEIMQGTTQVTREWENLQIKTKVPGPVLKYQTLTLYYENGLSRTIKFYMQEPWTLENAVTYGAQLDHREQLPEPGSKEEKWPNHISSQAGQNLTIFFQLPPALPKAMFPLEFVIESNRQNIENDKVGTIAVRSGASMFEESSGEIRIQYVKTVRWEEYDPDNDLHETDPESTDDNYAPNPDYPDKSNEQYIYVGDRVRCRFLTITDLSDGAITQDVTTVRIRNKYFNDLDIVFYRDLENPEKRPGE